MTGVNQVERILALWAVPRSTSTAFEWMMRQRGDLACYHEPFGEAWYHGEDPLSSRAMPESVRTPGLTLDSVRRSLASAAGRGPVFIKDFPHYVESIWTDEFLADFRHGFLIRDPLKTLTSMHHKWPDFHIKETGFPEQPQARPEIDLTDAAPQVREAYAIVEPHYRRLYEHRIVVE